MTKRRILSAEEQKQISIEWGAKERARNPGKIVSISVNPETDDSGEPVVHVLVMEETENTKGT